MIEGHHPSAVPSPPNVGASLADLPPPRTGTKMAWQFGGVVCLLIGALWLNALQEGWAPPVVLLSLVAGVGLLMQRRWGRWLAMLALASQPIVALVLVVDAAERDRALPEDTESMLPVLVIGAGMIGLGALAVLIWLAFTPDAVDEAPPGWYRVPTAPAAERFWNGLSWTEHLRVNGVPVSGWYVDPHDIDRWRFWDGQQWTTHVAPRG